MTPIEKMIAFCEKFPTLHGQDYLNYARALEKEVKRPLMNEPTSYTAYLMLTDAEKQELFRQRNNKG